MNNGFYYPRAYFS